MWKSRRRTLYRKLTPHEAHLAKLGAWVAQTNIANGYVTVPQFLLGMKNCSKRKLHRLMPDISILFSSTNPTLTLIPPRAGKCRKYKISGNTREILVMVLTRFFQVATKLKRLREELSPVRLNGNAQEKAVVAELDKVCMEMDKIAANPAVASILASIGD